MRYIRLNFATICLDAETDDVKRAYKKRYGNPRPRMGGSITNIEDLSPELKEKAKACKTPEELFALAKEEGIELSEDALNKISAGGIWDWDCPFDVIPLSQNIA